MNNNNNNKGIKLKNPFYKPPAQQISNEIVIKTQALEPQNHITLVQDTSIPANIQINHYITNVAPVEMIVDCNKNTDCIINDKDTDINKEDINDIDNNSNNAINNLVKNNINNRNNISNLKKENNITNKNHINNTNSKTNLNYKFESKINKDLSDKEKTKSTFQPDKSFNYYNTFARSAIPMKTYSNKLFPRFDYEQINFRAKLEIKENHKIIENHISSKNFNVENSFKLVEANNGILIQNNNVYLLLSKKVNDLAETDKKPKLEENKYIQNIFSKGKNHSEAKITTDNQSRKIADPMDICDNNNNINKFLEENQSKAELMDVCTDGKNRNNSILNNLNDNIIENSNYFDNKNENLSIINMSGIANNSKKNHKNNDIIINSLINNPEFENNILKNNKYLDEHLIEKPLIKNPSKLASQIKTNKKLAKDYADIIANKDSAAANNIENEIKQLKEEKENKILKNSKNANKKKNKKQIKNYSFIIKNAAIEEYKNKNEAVEKEPENNTYFNASDFQGAHDNGNAFAVDNNINKKKKNNKKTKAKTKQVLETGEGEEENNKLIKLYETGKSIGRKASIVSEDSDKAKKGKC